MTEDERHARNVAECQRIAQHLIQVVGPTDYGFVCLLIGPGDSVNVLTNLTDPERLPSLMRHALTVIEATDPDHAELIGAKEREFDA